MVGCVRNGTHVDNAAFVKKNFNTNKTLWRPRGAEDRPQRQLDGHAEIMHQNRKTKGVWFFDEALGDLETQRFRKEPARTSSRRYALTIEGKIGNFDITYAGAYMHRPTRRSATIPTTPTPTMLITTSYGGLANYQYYFDDAGNRDRLRASTLSAATTSKN